MGLLRSAFSLDAFKKSASSGKVNQARTPDQDLKDVISGNMPATDFDLRGYDPEVGGLSYEAGELTQALEDAGLHVVDDRMGRIFVGQTKEDVDRLMSASNPYEYGKAYGYSDDDIAAFYKRLRGDNDEIAYQEYLRDRQTSADVDSLVMQGFPESTARKIVSGELPMDFESRMQRAREQGYTMEALHAGNPDIKEFDPRAPRRTIDEGYGEDSIGSFFTDNPVIAASYSGPDSATYRVLIKPTSFGTVNAKGNYYNTLDASKYVRPSGEVVDSVEAANTYLGKMPSQTDDFGIMAKNVGDQGVIIENVVDMGPKTKPMRMVAEDVSGGNRMEYLTELEDKGAKTIIVQDPSTVRSYYSAAFDPDEIGNPNIMASPAPIGAVGGLLASEAATPEGQLNPLLAVPAEIGSALNEALVGTVDFLVPDTVNAVSELIGSEYRMPRLSDQELVRLYSQGGYMDEGYGRDAIRTATGLLSPL